VRAFPIGLSAFPASVRAFPICQTQADDESAQCTAQIRSDIAPNANPNLPVAEIAGYQPADLQHAYGVAQLASANGTGTTIGIVIAYHTPNLESDLNVYRAAFGLGACTSASGCLTIAELNNGKRPNSDPKWRTEATLDAEVVSALCPLCRIYVAEAKSANIGDLAAAVDLAAAYATVVNNSFAIPESAGAVAYESHWNHPGVPMVAGAGDGGFAWGVAFPASSRYVTAVGGTTVTENADGTFSSSVWPLGGSGCSAFVPKPVWQHDSGCATRTVNDVSALADPATGVAGYVTENGGWTVFGGTSVAAPVVSAIYALAGNTANVDDASQLYAQPQFLVPVTTGNDGTCSPAYLCTAGPGYNGPGGLGTPFR
jgi:subtilase family serine protease